MTGRTRVNNDPACTTRKRAPSKAASKHQKQTRSWSTEIVERILSRPGSLFAEPSVPVLPSSSICPHSDTTRNQMYIQATAGLVSALMGTTAIVQHEMQWRVQDGGNGHWYRFHAELQIGWSAANQHAHDQMGFLADIESGAEAEWLATMLLSIPGAMINQQYGPFIGGLQATGSAEPAGGWTWTSGRRWLEGLWASGEPTNSACGAAEGCAQLVRRAGIGGINDITNTGFGCSQRFVSGFLIEWSADCNGDGLVDYGQCRDGSLADKDGNNVPDCCESRESCCVGNLDGNQSVDGADLGILLNAWGICSAQCAADLDGDGLVNGIDLGLLLGNWGTCP